MKTILIIMSLVGIAVTMECKGQGTLYKESGYYTWVGGVATKISEREAFGGLYKIVFDVDVKKLASDRGSDIQIRTVRPGNFSAKEETLTIYPNPVKDKFTVRASTDLGGPAVIKNSIGVEVYRAPLTPEIDVSHLPVGVYILKVTNGTKVETQKFVKE